MIDMKRSASSGRFLRRRKYQTVVRVAPSNFVADLQRLREWPSMEGSLWRRVAFVKLTLAEISRLLVGSISGTRLKILDVGCGTGFISLELARRGHDVLGLDRSEKMVEIAKRTKNTFYSESGKLEYEVADFERWPRSAATFDVVLFSRVLHDLSNPEDALTKAHRLLRPRGKLICLEYAYDMIDRKAAEWLYQTRKSLELLGWYSSPHLPDDPGKGIDHIMRESASERKTHINTFEEMIRPLKRLFRQLTLSWHPYYFWDILSDIRIPNPRVEERFAQMLKTIEEYLLKTNEIRSVLFLYKGIKV